MKLPRQTPDPPWGTLIVLAHDTGTFLQGLITLPTATDRAGSMWMASGALRLLTMGVDVETLCRHQWGQAMTASREEV